MSDDDLAVTEARAARMVGFSVRRLRAWASRNIVGPGVERQLSQRNIVRLYRFQDLVELHVARELLDQGRSPQQIRKVVHHLRSRYEAPLRELRFAVKGERIYFQHPDGTWEGDRVPDQIVLHSVLDLDAIRSLVRRAVAPDLQERRVGKLVQRRGVVGGKPVFGGTRIPVTAIEPYLRRGLPDERILEAFPLLTAADIEAARRTLASA